MRDLIVRRRQVKWLIGSLVVLALPVGSAGATAGIEPSLTVGPISAGHGFKVSITLGCNTHGHFGNITVTKTGRNFRLEDSYFPRRSARTVCTASGTMGSGTARFRWGTTLDGALRLSHAGRRQPILQKGCSGPIGHSRNVKARGRLTISLHSRAFGKLVIRSAPAEFQIYDTSPTCTGPTGSSGSFTALYANWSGQRGIDAFRNANGHRRLFVFATLHAGKSATGEVADDFYGGSRLFSLGPDLRWARIGSVNPFLGGSLRFTRTASCNPQYAAGTLRGKLVLHDPVAGTITFPGSQALKSRGGPTLETDGTVCPVA